MYKNAQKKKTKKIIREEPRKKDEIGDGFRGKRNIFKGRRQRKEER